MFYCEPEFKIVFVSEVDVISTSSTESDERINCGLPEDEL